MDIIITNEPETLIVPDGLEAAVKLAAEKVAELYGLKNAEVSVTLTDDEHIHKLNREYRGVDRPTDVLSFALTESDEPTVEGGPETEILGDLILSVERVAAQAEEYGHSLKREAAFLTLHGMLHLLGYDHIKDEDREEMEAEQRTVMDALGISRKGEAREEKDNG